MNDFPELSVIIPVYNVQSELRTCLESVINQSYRNMEIIIIDDASTDDSAHIIEEYAGIVMAVIIVYAMILIFMTVLMGVMKV